MTVEEDYESDPEELTLPLTMRRREASDDEDGDGDGDGDERSNYPLPVSIRSTGESDGEGAAQVYEDAGSDIEEEEEEDEEEEDDEERHREDVSEEEEFEKEGQYGDMIEATAAVARGEEGPGEESAAAVKKENEPYAVPTAGAFYMHDDRFGDHGTGRHRRTTGGRKLWESKDNREWVHDRFEEMNLRDEQYDKERRRTGRGRFRGRGRYRGTNRGHVRGNGSRAFGDGDNQNRTYKGVRGRGPRRYEPRGKAKDKEMSHIQGKQSAKSVDNTSNTISGRVLAHTLNVQPDLAVPRGHVFASSLSSASPPFYPSGSSNQDVPVSRKRDGPIGSFNRNLPSSVLSHSEESLSMSHSTIPRGKNILDPNGPERSLMDDSVRPGREKQVKNSQSSSSGSSVTLNTRQSVQGRGQEKVTIISGQHNYQSNASLSQANKGSAQIQFSALQQRSVQSPLQTSSRSSSQPLGQRLDSGTNSSAAGEMESPPGSSKSKVYLSGKAKDSGVHVSGKGSFLYGGPQVLGATGPVGVTHGDQNFSAAPALLPVMQFGGQHHGGLGLSAVGMALPGYVAQPQLGFGNSEMTWVPVIAGAAGALGASYCSPYISVEGGFYSHSSGQTSSLGSGIKEAGINKPNNTTKSSQTSELRNDELGQRQNKPRRYSEMNFGQ